MTFAIKIAVLSIAQDKADAASRHIGSLCAASERGPMGLTPDNIKQSPEWRSAKASYDRSSATVRAIVASLMKHHKKQYVAHMKAEIAAKRAAKLGN